MTEYAFPTLERGYHGLELTDPGMNLRDWFAGKAFTSLVVGMTGSIGVYGPNGDDLLAKHAYQLADAMMKERNK